MQPTECAFDEPANLAQPVLVVASFGNLRLDAQPTEQLPQRLAVEGLVGHECVGFVLGPPRLAGHRRNSCDQRQRGRDIVLVGRRDLGDQRHSRAVGQQAVLAARAAAIGGIRPGFCPPSGAFTKLQSISTRDQSSWSAPRSLARNNSWICCHSPSFVHTCNRSWQVLYEQPNASSGRSTQAIPVFSTNRIAVSTKRCSFGCRPPSADCTCLGNSGATWFHSSSGNSLPAMAACPP